MLTTTATGLAAEHAQKQAPKSFEDIVPEHYRDLKDVFDKKDFDRLPDRKPWDHAIELLPDAQPVSCKAYPMAPKEQKVLDKFLEENLHSRCIRPSKSPWASPFFIVKKKMAVFGLYRTIGSLTREQLKTATLSR